MIRRLAAANLVAALLVGPAGSALGDASGAEIAAIDDAFDPQIVRIAPGGTVAWSNQGRSPHTVTADDGSFDSGSLGPGSTYERTFDRPGVYRFYCRFHGAPGIGMTGIVVVGDVQIPGPDGSVGPDREPVPTGFAPTVRVPADFGTIQEAVDHAKPGGMVLIAPGVYHESVTVTTPYITIRGEERNRTVLDGRGELANGIHVIEADGVAIENLTAHHYVLNGFQWTGVVGYRGSYLTAWDNGDYGLYAFDSRWGQFDHSYASGSPDSGFYIGQCQPCHALITDVLAVHNALGYSGTNAGGDLAIVNSEWRNNLSGIVPNTLDSEADAPQRGVLIAGNYVHDNNSTTADTKDLEYPTYGIGIVVAGGADNLVTENVVEDHRSYGIAVLPNLDRNLWISSGNEIRDNVVRRSGRADLALGSPAGADNCFEGNDPDTSSPPAIETLYGCDGPSLGSIGGGDVAPTLGLGTRFLDTLDGAFPHGDWRRQPEPPSQRSMPDAVAAPPQPAIPDRSVPMSYRIRDPASIASAPGPRVGREVTVLGVSLATSWWGLILGLYGYLLPFVLYAAWVSVALWDLIRQESAAIPHRARWMAAVLLVPFAGPVLYFGFGRSPIPKQLRLMLVLGGMGAYVVIAVLAALLGG
jgi:plastocyanin